MKIVVLAVMATALISAPAFAGGGGRGVAINANVLTGGNGLLGGLLTGHGGTAVNATVTTGKGGVLGALLGRGGYGGHSSSGCGCN